jgi:hypothetical protein
MATSTVGNAGNACLLYEYNCYRDSESPLLDMQINQLFDYRRYDHKLAGLAHPSSRKQQHENNKKPWTSQMTGKQQSWTVENEVQFLKINVASRLGDHDCAWKGSLSFAATQVCRRKGGVSINKLPNGTIV